VRFGGQAPSRVRGDGGQVAHLGYALGVFDPSIALLRDFVAINSVNPSLVPGAPGEALMADAVAAHLSKLGLVVEVQPVADGRSNVIGILEGRARGRSLMFCGHLDTVGVEGMTAPFEPVLRDGRLYGRGAQDMKAGVAAMIDAARVIASGTLAAGRLVVAAVIDEEYASIGADALITEWRADAAVVTEPTDQQIGIAHKGFAWYEIEMRGRAAHGSRPLEGRDAILRMGRALSALESLDRELQQRPPHPLMGTGSLHASLIEGGRELSSYPDRCVLTLERRTIEGEDDEVVDAEMAGIIDRLRAGDREISVSCRRLFSRPAYHVARDHELPRSLAAAVVACAGTEAPITAMTFWTDAAILGHAGIPSVLFGPGGAGLHSVEEYVNVADVIACRDALAEFARAWLRE
jgi:acetylornithine deacetylase